MIPNNVSNYYSAQWWITIHVGVPLASIYLIIFLVLRVQEWRDDMKDDDGKPTFQNDLSITQKSRDK